MFSVYIRLKLNASPAFQRMKAEKKGSKSPLTESFFRYTNNKYVPDRRAHLLPATEVIVAVLCWMGAFMLTRQLRADAAAFNRAMTFAVIGLTLGFLLWQVGFMSIGGEWFGTWMSSQWNGVPSAFRFVMVILAVLIFVAMPDGD